MDKEKTNLRAKQVIDRIERALQGVVLEELRSECKGDWWLLGVPKKVRLEVIARFEGDDGRRGSKEAYFDLIDYRRIALDRWDIFAGILAYGNSGNKEKRTKWLVTVNDKRNIVSHPSSAIALSLEELAELEHYEQWLANNIAGTVAQAEAQSASVEEEDTAET